MKVNFRILTVVAILCKPLEILASCQTFYEDSQNSALTERDPSNPVPLECQFFAGDPTLHAIVYGCNTLDQEVGPSALPERILATMPYTQKCEAKTGEFTTFICYDMDPEASNFDDFVAEAEANAISTCEESDVHDAPIYMYQVTTAEYVNGVGDQTTRGNATGSFDPFFAVTYPIYAKKVVNDGTVLTYAPTPVPPTSMEPVTADTLSNSSDPDVTSPGGEGSVGQGDSDNSENQSSSTTISAHLRLLGWLSMIVWSYFL